MKIVYTILTLLFLGILYLAYTLWFELGKAPRDIIFQNEIETPVSTSKISETDLIREMLFPSNPNRKPPAPIPSITTKLGALADQPPSIVWFGHSSYLITLNGFTVLADPVMSGHSAPLPFLVNSFPGTDVFGVEDLPIIDVLLISHDHYDHLDYETIQKLKDKVKHIVVPQGVGEHFRFWGYDPTKITELKWHESTTIDGHRITSTPARHFSGRGLTRNNTLWSSFVIKSDQHAIYMGGDSGYGPHFKAIGQQYGPFDLAMLESGQYNENWRNIHMMPEETVQAAQDLGAKTLFPVHWGKFVLSLHDWNEPIHRVTQAAQAQQQQMITPIIGEVVHFNDVQSHNKPWWKAIEQKDARISTQLSVE